jgi:hypothetical protein
LQTPFFFFFFFRESWSEKGFKKQKAVKKLRTGTTLMQLVPLPLKKPRTPSSTYILRKLAHKPEYCAAFFEMPPT